MFQKNRKVQKDEINSIPFEDRIEMEAQITDARAKEIDAKRYQSINYDDYVQSIDWRRYAFGYLGDVKNKRVLDVACGYSMTPIIFALSGARVSAVDVAPKTLEKVREVAELRGVDHLIDFHCGPAEDLPFDNQTFDLIYGGAALHHLVLDKAGPEFSRLLKPGGKGAFQDPMGNNLLIEFIRDNINYAGKHPEKGTDKPLRLADIDQFGRHFNAYHWKGFGITSTLVRAFKRLKKYRRTFEKADEFILKTIPPFEKYAQYSVICISN